MDFSGVRILVVGDVMLDRYVSGTAGRISPEAPVPVACVQKRWCVPGGAANAARNLARLGVTVKLVGLAGDDADGQALHAALAQEHIEDGLICHMQRQTTCKTRIIAQGQQLLRLDEEKICPPAPDEKLQLAAQVLKFLPGCQAVVLSDYGKGVLLQGPEQASLCAMVIRAAHDNGIPVLVDPKGGQWHRYSGADCVTPNSKEFLLACGLEEDRPVEQDRHKALADSLRERYALGHVLLTRGAKGMALFGDAEPAYIRAAVREVADVSGAGDTVIAVLAACIASGQDWESSTRTANTAAGVAVGKMGTAPVSVEELNAALHEQVSNPKLYSLPALLEQVQDWRRKNNSIVFTNGCFDLLHPGHISLIRQCASLGDRLVVGLNSDASVRRLKGPSRPIQDEQSRALLLAALQDVDAVVLFGEDTSRELIHALRPDVLVKGGDYTAETVVGADFVKSYGGRLYLASLVDGCSTTNLVARMSADG